MRSSGSSGKRPGRPLPLRVEDITSTKVNDETKQLIVALLTVIRNRFSSVRDMIRFAMTQPKRPVWAVGSPANERHLSAASSAVSKFLGKAAERAPDWPNVAWIVQACTPVDDRDQVLARMAGRWCAATGASWPPGYVGWVDHGDDGMHQLTDPDHAPDDATRAQLYQQRLRDADAAIAGLLRDKQELQLQVEALAASGAHAGRRITDLESAVHDKDREYQLQLVANRQRFEQTLRQLQGDYGEQHHRLSDRLQEVIHHLAVLAAHLISTAQHHGDLLPIPGLAVDTELRDLLDPPRLPDTPTGDWLMAYLRAMVLLHHGLDYPVAFPAVADNLAAVVAHGQQPDHDTITALLRAHPMLHAYARPLHRAAQAELAGRPVTLTPVDPRTPTEQRLQDADTAPLRPPPPPPVRWRPAQPPSTPRRPNPPPKRASSPPQPPSDKITVAELLARHGQLPPRRHPRHRLPSPPTDQSG